MSTTTRITVEQVAPAIAGQLGEGWSAGPSTHHFDHPWQVWYLRHTDGTAVRLTLSENTRGRLSVKGELPEARDDLDVKTGSFRRGVATADPARPAAAIAGQIRRQVLPVLLKSTRRIQELVDAARDLEAQKDAVRQRLRTVPGFELGLHWQGKPRGAYGYATNPAASVEVRGDEDGAYVGIELRGLTADQAERVLRALTATD
ncbi:hypothetical protein EDD90_2805 [Streptomyces sp. Ag109_O5-1]|uniref:hypothetical protein n=1 Tax=Streptomyces sp. Ag109_O5-1 TaxID=1938851 RepID=UPI000F4F988A|nr:hypothetical protein [Streptomyces sp. Ag109_O5-1]RPE39787.1 hypothetical protein EDD90_2805 [Streptomyces sp. Ag109_O5-1]